MKSIRKVELGINIKMVVPCQSALVLLRYFFKVRLTFEMLTVRGHQHSFSTHGRVFLGKFQGILGQEMSRPEGDSNTQPSDPCRML